MDYIEKKELALREIEDLFPLLFPFDRTSLCHPQRVSGIFSFFLFLSRAYQKFLPFFFSLSLLRVKKIYPFSRRRKSVKSFSAFYRRPNDNIKSSNCRSMLTIALDGFSRDYFPPKLVILKFYVDKKVFFKQPVFYWNSNLFFSF